jgi:lysophospholipase L1-like esterase
MKTKTLLTWTALFSVFFLWHLPACPAAPLKIMPLGDSITGSPGCWRALLWKDLTDNGFTNIDFVGTQYPQGCAFPYDGEHEGHGGALATNVAGASELVGWLGATHPDIVLMHFGTNDVWSNRSTQQILNAFTTLVNQMRQDNADMIILVAQIIPVAPDSCPECPQRTIDLNQALPAWAQDLSTSRSPIVVVDHFHGFDSSSDTSDGVHPNDAGIRKIADNWYGPLSKILAGENPVCNPTVITPFTQIDNGSWINTNTVSLTVGDRLILSPQSADEGQWSWTGPNGYTAGSRQVTLDNIQILQQGIYTVTFTNACGATSIQSFKVSVQAAPEEPDPEPTPDNPGGCDGNGSSGGCG